MAEKKKYYSEEETQPLVLNEPEIFMMTFSSQQEADDFRLKKSLERTDLERFKMMCRLMRIGKMLSNAKVSEI